MRKSIIAAIAVVAVIGSTAVYAQHRHHHQRMSAQDRSAFVDAKIASVHAGLQLTPDQDKMWPPVEAAVRDFAKQRIDRANARASERDLRRAERDQKGPDQKGLDEKGAGDRGPDQAAPQMNRDPVARLRERADTMAATATGLKRIADAADPLYKSLDDGQKRRLATLTRMGVPHGGRGHGFEHGFGPGGDSGPDRGPGRDHGPDGPQRL